MNEFMLIGAKYNNDNLTQLIQKLSELFHLSDFRTVSLYW